MNELFSRQEIENISYALDIILGERILTLGIRRRELDFTVCEIWGKESEKLICTFVEYKSEKKDMFLLVYIREEYSSEIKFAIEEATEGNEDRRNMFVLGGFKLRQLIQEINRED